MSFIKIKLNTWNKNINSTEKFKRGIASREGFIEYDLKNKNIILKDGSKKWKPWDVTISRRNDRSYISSRKDLYSGLCFINKQAAEQFMLLHKKELDQIAASHPLFDHWSTMMVIKRFEPKEKLIYGKDITEDEIN